MKRYLITGGAGFVGSNLAICLKQNEESVHVIALDNLKRRGSELNIPRLRKYGVDFVHGDIRNKEDLQAVDKIDCIIECSAEPSVLAGFSGSPEYLINTNLMGTVNCLEVARRCKADFIFLSTSRVYPIAVLNDLEYRETETRFELAPDQRATGVSSSGFSEEFPLNGVRSLYGATKLASELILHEYIDMYGIRGVINRCGVITGPWQMGKVDQGFVVLWTARHIYDGKLAYFGYGGTGKQVRDVLHVEDLYRLIDLQLKDFDNHNGQVYNVGGGRNVSTSLKELTELCVETTGNRIAIDSVKEDRVADIRLYLSDCSKISLATGWKPERDMASIIQEISRWIYDNKEQLRDILS